MSFLRLYPKQECEFQKRKIGIGVGRSVSASSLENIDAVHEIILKNRRIRLKRIAETEHFIPTYFSTKKIWKNAEKASKTMFSLQDKVLAQKSLAW